jgi:NAD(P)H-hydrate epimerase
VIEKDRARVLELLRRGGRNAGRLARALEVSVPTVHRWIRELRAEGVRIDARRGRSSWTYELAPEPGSRPPARVRGLPAYGPRPPTAHKSSVGRILVMAGAEGMAGAAALACRAAFRAGAGLVYLAAPRAVVPVLAVKVTEAVIEPCGRSVFRPSDAARMMRLARRCRAAALGPGITRAAEPIRFARRIFEALDLPMVVDADGLAAVGPRHAAPRILTPHEGEMAGLMGLAAGAVHRDREGVARRAARRFKATVILKGHRSVVTDGRRLHVNRSGNPGMASAGTGDVLTGILVALMGQGFAVWDAAVLGTYLHGRAGDLAAASVGPISLIASDLVDALPQAVREQSVTA